MINSDTANIAAIVAASAAAINILVTIANIIINSINQRRNTFASIVSSNRIRWVEDLRKDISQYIGLATAIRRLKQLRVVAQSDVNLHTFMKTELELKSSFSTLENIDKDISDKSDQAIVLQSLLQIKLDMSQKEQLDVWNKLESLSSEDKDKDSFIKSIEELTSSTRTLLYKEWRKVEMLK